MQDKGTGLATAAGPGQWMISLKAKPVLGDLGMRGEQVIDGTEGRAHHVRLRGIEAFADAPPAGGIVEVVGLPDDPWPTQVLANRSDIDLDCQVTAPGATWLDYRLVEREHMPLAMNGSDKRCAMPWKHVPSISRRGGLVRRQGPSIVPQRDLLATLRRRELDAIGASCPTRSGCPPRRPQPASWSPVPSADASR
jgi:Protein of unknown function (DUF3363)